MTEAAFPELPEHVHAARDVVYGSAGGRDLRADVFLPTTRADAPGLVFVHGGGWSGGGRNQFYRHAIRMAERGFVGACIEYRFSQEALFPAAVEDAKCAVRWLRSSDYGVDGSRIGSIGGSSGGHLAAMLAATDASHGMEGDGGHSGVDSRVNAAVCFNPVMDLTAMVTEVGMGEKGAVPRFLGGMPEGREETYDAASPVTHVDEQTAPTLMLHGTGDGTVPIAQSEGFLAKLEAAGVWGELAVYAGAKHGFFNGDPWFEPTLNRMEEFLVRHLGGAA